MPSSYRSQSTPLTVAKTRVEMEGEWLGAIKESRQRKAAAYSKLMDSDRSLVESELSSIDEEAEKKFEAANEKKQAADEKKQAAEEANAKRLAVIERARERQKLATDAFALEEEESAKKLAAMHAASQEFSRDLLAAGSVSVLFRDDDDASEVSVLENDTTLDQRENDSTSTGTKLDAFVNDKMVSAIRNVGTYFGYCKLSFL